MKNTMTAGRENTINKQDWLTPEYLLEKVREVFEGQIYLDPCGNSLSKVGAKITFYESQNGLTEEWNYPTIFVNPPYGRAENKTSIKNWIRKCEESYRKYGNQIIALVPVATNTSHWKNYVFQSCKAIGFIKEPRIKFLTCNENLNKGAPMACAFIYWGTYPDLFSDVMSGITNVVYPCTNNIKEETKTPIYNINDLLL